MKNKYDNFIQAFEEQAATNPANIAAVAEGQFMNYKELNQKANCLARKLKECGIGKGKIVGLVICESIDLLIGLIGILKTGACFLPIDSALPEQRINYMMQDSKLEIIVSHSSISENLIINIPVINVDNYDCKENNSENLNIKIDPEDPAYVIYTSGTTGKPKGVVIEERSLVNYFLFIATEYNIKGSDRAALVSSFSFDLGYTVIFTTLASGALVHIVKKEVYRNPDKLGEYLQENQITWIKCTPSLLSMLINSYGFAKKDYCSTLSKIFLGGEQIRVEDVDVFHKRYPNTIVINHYGPTETTIGVATYPIDFNDFDNFKKTLVIGKPIANIEFYVCDAQMQPKEHGVMGELCISGAALARGYLNRPDLTKEKFVWISKGDNTKRRVYKTGDRARILDSGNVQILGRMDEQIKIHGYRVELGDIEVQLRKYNKIKNAAVLAEKQQNGDTVLKAYCELKERCTIKELAEHLKRGLPDYMIPRRFIEVSEMPITLNGKMDKKKLASFTKTLESGEDYVGSSSLMELEILRACQEVLGRDNMSVNDNFFLSGGDSIKAVQLIAKIHKFEIELEEIYHYPTVRLLCANHEIEDVNPFINTEIYQKLISRVRDDSVVEEVISSKKVNIESITAFNEVFYKDCFYNALFPALQYAHKEINRILCKDVFLYKGIKSDGRMQLTSKIFAGKGIEELLVTCLGIFTVVKMDESSLVNELRNALSNGRLAIVRVDCMYESIRPDLYRKNHFPHALLVCGFDDESKRFTVIEQSDVNKLDYTWRTITYQELQECNKEYRENFASKNKPIYYEFYDNVVLPEEIEVNSAESIYCETITERQHLIQEGLNSLNQFSKYYEEVVSDELLLKQECESLIFQVNDILLNKHAEEYKNKAILGSAHKCSLICAEINSCWNVIKVILEKYYYSHRYKREKFLNSIEKIKKICELEKSFYEELKNGN
nr:amino acid adenylation domain-containing protein [uncultured Lachnoclostridium sp.]